MKCLPFVRGHHDKPKICVERDVSGVYQVYRWPCVSSHGVLCYACHMALLSYTPHAVLCVPHVTCHVVPDMAHHVSVCLTCPVPSYVSYLSQTMLCVQTSY